jgi:hypothetical protein
MVISMEHVLLVILPIDACAIVVNRPNVLHHVYAIISKGNVMYLILKLKESVNAININELSQLN